MRIARTLLLLLSPLSTVTSSAQEYWRPAQGPYGGTIVSGILATDTGLYAATVGGLFRSDDQGATWTPDMEGITASGVDVRDVIQAQDGTTLASTYGAGVFRRWPGTNRWEATQGPDAFTQGLDQGADGTIYAATIRGIMRSDNGGASWVAHAISSRNPHVKDVADIDGVVYAATPEGVYKSLDRGETWDWSSSGMTTFDVDVLFAASNGDLYAGTSPITGGCTLFRTRSAGRFWTCVQPATDPIRAGGMAEDSQGRLYFGGYRYVYRSDDEGSTWVPTTTTTTTVHAIATIGSTVVAGTYGRGVLRSENRGSTWSTANHGLQSAIRDLTVGPDGSVVAATLGGVFQSKDLGSTWELLDDLDSPVRPALSVLFDAQGRLLSGTLNGLFRLDFHRDEWEALGPPGTPPVRDMKFGPDGDLFVGYHEGIYHLRGSNWVSYPLIGPDQAARDVVAIEVNSQGTLFAGGNYDSFMKYQGSSGWIRLTSAATPYFEAQNFVRDDSGTLYAATRYFGVMRSNDLGQTWTPMINGLTGSEDIRSIAFDPNGVMFIGSFGNGVYRYNRMRNSWELAAGGMETSRRVTSLAFDAAGNGFAGTYGGGVFVHLAAGGTAVEPGASRPKGAPSVFAPYPNPTRGHSVGEVAFEEAGTVTLRVFDLTGRLVAHRHQFVLPGSNALPLPLEGLPPGTYLVQVSDGRRIHTAVSQVIR